MTEKDAKLILDVRISRFDHAGDVNEALEIAKHALEEIQQYREIGTVDECQQAAEKQKAKKPNTGTENGRERKCCSSCGCFYAPTSKYCSKCGQAIEWSEEE